MPIFQAAIRGRHRHRQRGFSLIELLSVVIILGLVGIVVILSVPPARPGAAQAALQIAAKLNAARNIAIMRGEVIGVSLQGDQLQFLRYQAPQWRVIEEPRGALKGIVLPSGVSVEFEISAEAPKGMIGRVTGGAEADSFLNSEEGPASPDFIFSPTGEIPQFNILLRQGIKQWQVLGDEGGAITIQKGDGRRS